MKSKVSLSPKSKVINFIILKKFTRLCLNVADQRFLCASVENNAIYICSLSFLSKLLRIRQCRRLWRGIKLVNCPTVTLFIPISWQSCNVRPRPQTPHRSELAGMRFWSKNCLKPNFDIGEPKFQPKLQCLKKLQKDFDTGNNVV